MECVPGRAGGLTGLDMEARRALLDALVQLRASLHENLADDAQTSRAGSHAGAEG